MAGRLFSYGDYECATAKKSNKRIKFLAEMEKSVPLQALIFLIKHH